MAWRRDFFYSTPSYLSTLIWFHNFYLVWINFGTVVKSYPVSLLTIMFSNWLTHSSLLNIKWFGPCFFFLLTLDGVSETGSEPFNLEYLGMREPIREHDGKKTHWIAFDYRAEVNPDEVKIMEPDKCAEIRWCTIEEIPTPRHSQFDLFLESYKNKL